ncbi:transmembrane protein 92 [Phascolarctos cinereus]|uniref:Transmembrane protein 92 isoform X1 n=1 Tax=Phascolarctos cinereus TaxID=38626 RepID=A0A6P5L6J2_PHACI|nr:transmembrane protein 92 isoform X1 [Phascolarctos cinereus]
MPHSWVYRLLSFLPSLLLSILAGLQQVTGGCQLHFFCPEGFECCGNGCCVKTEHFSGPMRTFVISFLVIIPLLCICGLFKRLCRACWVSESEPSTQREVPVSVSFSNPPVSPETPAPAPFGPPPPYSEVVQKPVLCPPAPREPPPPYTPTPVVTTQSTQRGIVNTAF